MKYNLLFASIVLIASASYAAETIYIKKGQPFILELESNPTTGSMWELTSLGKENRVKVEEQPYKPHNTGLIGSGGIQSWKVTPLGKGLTRAVFDYKRSWESTSIKTEIFDFIVE